MTDFLVQRVARQPRSVAARIALGLVLAAVAVGVRMALAPWIGMGAPFAAFVLAVLVAAVFGGVLSSVTTMTLLAVGGALLLQPVAAPMAQRRMVLSVLFFLASSGFVIWVVTLLRAALAREVAAREGERLLKLEMHHRVKNTLAVVQALADQTFRAASDTETARRDFAGRLAALALTHDLLVDAGWTAVTVAALADQALAPFRPADPARLRLEGPAEAAVTPEAAVALALCLHELATNAAKHGALSGSEGAVRLGWRVESREGRRQLALDWAETGGPKPRPAGRRQGFGKRLLSRALAAQPGAWAELTLPPEGARWRAGFDL